MRGPGVPAPGGLQIDLKSPGMVAAVLASSSVLRPPHYPSRDTVKKRREQFERGLSEPVLKLSSYNCHPEKKLERGRSYDLLKHRRENEAQRLVKYRSSSSLISVDSGFCLSRAGSSANSTEDLRPLLTRSISHDRLSRRKSSETSHNKCLTRSITTNSFGFSATDSVTGSHHHHRLSSERSLSSLGHHNNVSITRSSCTEFTSSTPDLSLSSEVISPPPLPPKTRPPLPPRRSRSSDIAPSPPPRYGSYPFWDADSELGSGHTSDTSLPEYLVDESTASSCGGSELNKSSAGNSLDYIPESFPFKHSLQKFLSDLSDKLSTEVIIKNVYENGPGYLDVIAHTQNTSAGNIYSLPQNGEPARPASLSPGIIEEEPQKNSGVENNGETALSKQYRTELQVNNRNVIICK